VFQTELQNFELQLSDSTDQNVPFSFRIKRKNLDGPFFGNLKQAFSEMFPF